MHTHRTPTGIRRAAEFSAYAVIALFSLFLKTGFPKPAVPYSVFDDELFVRAADSLRHTHWFGPYDKFTLAKGSFYPFFIAVTNVMHIPLYIGEQILYVLVCLLTSRYLARTSRRPALGVFCFALLALNPIFWNTEVTRAMRENIYISLSLGLVALTVALCWPAASGGRSRATQFVLGLATGLVAACYWMTREEGVWLAPTLFAIVLFALVRSRATGTPAAINRGRMRISGEAKLIALGAAAAIGGFGLLVGTVRAVNYIHYGEFETVETHASDFTAAYGALTRIHQDTWQRYVVFPKDARERAYAVSAAARELQPYLDGDNSRSWARISCSQVGDPRCLEVGAGWFMWAFRDAVALAGHTHSGGEAMAFYRRLADEINTACDAKQIPCDARRSTMAPPFRFTYIPDALLAARQVALNVSTIGSGIIGSPPSFGDANYLVWFRSVTGTISPPSDAAQAPEPSAAVKLADWVNAAYHTCMPILEAAAGLALLAAIISVFRGAPVSVPVVFCVASLIAAASRVAMLGYLEVSFMPSLNSLYASPASPFVLLFVVTGLYAGIDAFRGRRSEQSRL